MELRQLGKSTLRLTTVGFGSWAIGGGDWSFGWGDQNEDDAIQAILAAVRGGINWIDTAPVYGGGISEQIVGKAISQLPVSQRPLIATKCGRVMRSDRSIEKMLKRDSILAECDASLKRLGVDCIDLYQMHWPEPDSDIEQGWSTLVELKQLGKVREIGVSNHNVQQLQRLQAIHPVCSLQPPYSLLNRNIENEILPYCLQQQIGVIAYSPLAKGLLTGKFTIERARQLSTKDHRSRDPQFQSPTLDAHLGLVDCLRNLADKHGKSLLELAVAWVLRRSEVTSAIVGARNPGQVAEILRAGQWQLPTDDAETIQQLLSGHQQALRSAAQFLGQ
jgi:aryl-alcohol dehydrogenase-like predicted oxidoreductase